MSSIFKKIINLVVNGKYEITYHADEEAQEDDVDISDIKNAIKTGKIVKKYTHDLRGTRYKIQGLTLDNRKLNIILRLNNLGEVRILTIFIERGDTNDIWQM